MTTIKKIFLVLIIFFIFLLYIYKLPGSFVFESDFSRDLNDIIQIAKGKPMLIGPKLSFGGIFTGPYYYYLFLPVFFLSQYNIASILIFNSLIFALAAAYFFIKLAGELNLIKALIPTISLVLLSVYIFSARNPGNAFSYLPFLLFFLTYIIFNKLGNKVLFLLGLLGGIIVNFHLVNLVIILPIFVYIFISLKRKVNIKYLTTGFFFSFLPLIIFEIKHNFIMFENTFINRSYLTFMENKNLPSGITLKKNIFENLILISQQMRTWFILHPLVYFFIGLIIVWKNKLERKFLILYFFSFLSFLLLVLFLRFQFAFHYLFPVVFLIFFTTIIILAKSRFFYLVVLLIFLQIYYFPKHLYSPSIRKWQRFEKAVNYLVDNKLINKNESFNIIQIRPETNLTPLGHEFRFFFRKRDYRPDSEFEYKKSKTLFIFSEIPNLDIKQLDSWEAKEYGKEFLKNYQKYLVDGLTIYKISKNKI
jgi:hypothetical protein